MYAVKRLLELSLQQRREGLARQDHLQVRRKGRRQGDRLANENGTFTFEKSGEDWKAKFGKGKDAPTDLEKFDKTKADSLVRAFKALSAVDYGDDKTKTPPTRGSPNRNRRSRST